MLHPSVRRELVAGLSVAFSASSRPQITREGWAAPVMVPTIHLSFKGYYDGLAVRLSWPEDQAVRYKISLRSTSHASPGMIFGNLDLAEELQDIYDPLSVEVALAALESHSLVLAAAERDAIRLSRSAGKPLLPDTEAICLLRALREPWEEVWGSSPRGVKQ